MLPLSEFWLFASPSAYNMSGKAAVYFAHSKGDLTAEASRQKAGFLAYFPEAEACDVPGDADYVAIMDLEGLVRSMNLLGVSPDKAGSEPSSSKTTPKFVGCCLHESSKIKCTLELAAAKYIGLMQSSVVTTTGLGPRTMVWIKFLLEALGGVYKNVLDSKTTHVIATRAGSAKHKGACKCGKPTLKPEWLFDCFLHGQSLAHDKYLLPLCAGYQISASGLDRKTKERIEKLVTENGGTYYKGMPTTTTHLICHSQSGTKWSAAIKWKTVHVVNVNWLEKWIITKGKIEERNPQYQPSHPSELAAKAANNIPGLDDEEVPVLVHADSLNTAAYQNLLNVEESNMGNEEKRDKTPLPPVVFEPSRPDYLAHCVVYLHEVDDRTRARDILRVAGGTRLAKLRSWINYVVSDNYSPDTQRNKFPPQVKKVTSAWLEACYKAKSWVDPAPYNARRAYLDKQARDKRKADRRRRQNGAAGPVVSGIKKRSREGGHKDFSDFYRNDLKS